MSDGWFPRYSPDGKHVSRGCVSLSVDGQLLNDNGISCGWLSPTVVFFRQHHAPAQLCAADIRTKQQWTVGSFQTVFATANNGRWAAVLLFVVPTVVTDDGRRFEGFGGGDSGCALTNDGHLGLLKHDGSVWVVKPGETVPVQLAPLGRNIRAAHDAIVWEANNRIYGWRVATQTVDDLTTSADEFGPVPFLVDGQLWILTYTNSGQCQIHPWGSLMGRVVKIGETFYPDAAWDGQQIRVGWTDRNGFPDETVANTDTPDDLSKRPVVVPPPPPVVEPPPNPEPEEPVVVNVPNYLVYVEEAKNRYPSLWAAAHNQRPNGADFVIQLARDLNEIDSRVGVNGKRGNPNDISQDVLAFAGLGTAVDVRTGKAMEIVDVIASAGAPNAAPAWNVAPGGPGDKGTWIDPFSVALSGNPLPDPVDPLPPPVLPPPAPVVDLTPVLDAINALARQPGVDFAPVIERLDGIRDAVTQQTAQHAEMFAGLTTTLRTLVEEIKKTRFRVGF